LGGRVSEELFIGEIGTGAYSDFQQATNIVRSMIIEYGMSEKLGPMQFGTSQGQVFLGRDIGHEQNYSDQIAYEIDQEMQRFINECYERCKQLLTEHAKEVHLIAETLLEVETLELEQIKSLIETGTLDGLKKDGQDGGNGSSEPGEPTIDSVGDVRVRIQGKTEDTAPAAPVGDIPNDVPGGTANDRTNDPVVDTPQGTVSDTPGQADSADEGKDPNNGGSTPTV
ncbi:MAG: cell division protein FtsH, partial [Clostridium lundense]|nr:cell division protein FtsH [Clostridium lundense]